MSLRKTARSLSNLPIWFDLLWLAALALYVLAGAAIVPFHGDESTQIFMGRDTYVLFLDGDIAKVFYDGAAAESPIEQHLRIVNGTISKTIYGGLAALNGLDVEEINKPWEWDYDYEGNRAAGSLPDAELLRQARLASSAQLALAVGIFFLFTRLSISRPVAYLASLIFALHPTALINGRRAMMEGSHLLGMMLVLLAAVWLLRERTWLRFALLGICCGFAIAAKHPNAIIVALVFLACGSRMLFEIARAAQASRDGIISVFVGLLSAAAVTVMVFLLFNPAWWRAPLRTAAAVLSERMELLERQIERHGGYESGIDKIDGFWQHVFAGEIQYYEDARWAEYAEIDGQIAKYEASGWAGIRIGGAAAGLACLALTAAGAWIFIRDRRIHSSIRWLIMVWGGGLALVTLLVTPLSWTRYYLPILPFVHLAMAGALATILQFLWKRNMARFNA